MRAVLIILIIIVAQLSATAQPPEKILLTTDKQWYYPGETVWVSINTFNACSDTLAQQSAVAYVELLGADGKAVAQSKIKVEEAHGEGSIAVGDNIASGNYEIVAYTSWMKNFGGATFARKPVFVVNPLRPSTFNTSNRSFAEPANLGTAISIQTSKKQYTKREPVKVNFSVNSPSRVAVSVYKIDELEKGDVNVYTSQITDPCTIKPSSKRKSLLERNGHIVLGRITDKRTQAPASGIRGYLSPIEFPDQLFVATSDSSGLITFDVGELPGRTELVLNTDPSTKDMYTIDLVSPFAEPASTSTSKGSDDVFASNAQVVDEAMISAQVQRIFSGADTSYTRDTLQMTPFYGKPDALYIINEYVHFSTVEEILREYVYSVNVQRRGGKMYPIVLDGLTKKPFPEGPLILVNGVPIFDTDQFMQMNSDEFQSLAVVARRFFIGHQMFYGIIDVRLNTSLKEFGANARIMDYDGTEVTKKFMSPDYSNEAKRSDRKPDFRNVLYWNPSITTDNNGSASIEFYTSDVEGEYLVVVQSVSKDGRINLNKSIIEVK